MTATVATSDAGVARTAAANRANRERHAARLAREIVGRLSDLDKTTFAALAFAVVDEVERRAAERRAGAR